MPLYNLKNYFLKTTLLPLSNYTLESFKLKFKYHGKILQKMGVFLSKE